MGNGVVADRHEGQRVAGNGDGNTQKCECFHPPIGVKPTWMSLQIDRETSEVYVWEKLGAVAQSWVITRRMRPPGMHRLDL
jgi:hypothetical protein